MTAEIKLLIGICIYLLIVGIIALYHEYKN